ncbi:glycosyl transferase family 2 [Thermotomaculum hydrothermale]|uniref:Glycosyl transferase family 2 n=1 Tax=Thermotomaculum hydrothermale TaxID=981385 RepID=A0A7R6SY81_9BACT|nr:glycosyltransferase family 2 protein [Thermotomaculum hydrothermale]BBB32350.1 glycosyl transferase family 2 [Thermotomaculum hydrothermale]
MKLSLIIPVYNEKENIDAFLSEVIEFCKSFSFPYEIIVVNDGSSDGTERILNDFKDEKVRIIHHKHNIGNGGAVKTGIRNAKGEYVIMIDGDGQHYPKDIARILEKLEEGYHLVVGARDSKSQASFFRAFGNFVYNKLASYVADFEIKDLTSGLRGARREVISKFLYMFPNGFSYPSTSTLAILKAGYSLCYVSIKTRKRKGKSKIRILKDGLKFFNIIAKITTLFSPMKIFFPVSLLLFVSAVLHFLYRYFVSGKYTLFTGILLLASIFTLLMGLISEQISTLYYKDIDTEND